MSLIARFKKPNGFANLVQLLESCSPKKRESMLKIIHEEDPDWGELAKTKILSTDIVFSWPAPVIMEIVTTLAPKVTAIALKRQTSEIIRKVTMESLPKSFSEEILDFMRTHSPSNDEIQAAESLIIGKVRDLVNKKIINLMKLAPAYVLSDPTPKENLTPCVLVAHADAQERFKICQMFKRTQYVTMEASDGNMALGILKNTNDKNFIAVFADSNLPVQDGFELMLHAREDKKFRKLPFIIVSKTYDKQHVVTAKQMGLADVLVEPISYEQLLKSISTLNNSAGIKRMAS